MLGREPRRFGGIDWRTMRRRSAQILTGLHLDIDPNSLLNSHSLAVQQLVAIARAIDVQAKVLILDEPTSSLDTEEVAELFRVIRSLKDSGCLSLIHICPVSRPAVFAAGAARVIGVWRTSASILDPMRAQDHGARTA